MMIDAHKTTQILHELSYHYQSEIEMLKDICTRLEHQLILLDENVEINEFRKLFEISRETEYNSKKTLELLLEAKARADELITFYQKTLDIKIDSTGESND